MKQTPIEIKQGATWKARVQILNNGTARDLTGYKAYLQVRENYHSDPILDLSTENGSIDIDLENSLFVINVSSDVTKTLNFIRADYDMFIVLPNNDVEKILFGPASLIKSITRF